MEQAPQFLMDADDKGIDEMSMDTLQELIEAHDLASKELDEANAIAKAKKEAFNHIVLDRIPEFLLSHGVSDMKLVDGRKVIVKESISVTVKDNLQFMKWLRDRDEMDIVKVKYQFSRMEGDRIVKLTDFLTDEEYDFEIDESIHSATKNKYFNELLNDMSRADLPEWVVIFDIRKATIK